MQIMNLYADLQVNPCNLAAYRSLAEHYRSVGMINESEAFLELIRKKFDANHPHSDQEQCSHAAEGT